MRTNLRRTTLSTVFSLMIVGTSLFATTHKMNVSEASQQESDFANLTLLIASPKSSYVKLEPISFALSLKNNTRQPIRGHSAIEFSDNCIELFVGLNNGQMERIDNLSVIQKQTIVTPRNIESGETQQAEELLSLDLEKVFPVAGTYKIQAVLYNTDRSKNITSNFLTISVNEPSGRDNEAFQFIRNSGNASDFFSGRKLSGNPQSRQIFEQFEARFGDSSYGDYVDYLLGESYYYGDDDDKAMRRFEKLLRKSNFIFSDKVKDYLDKIKKRKRDKEKR